jgi:arylsulfatase A-like enzyme
MERRSRPGSFAGVVSGHIHSFKPKAAAEVSPGKLIEVIRNGERVGEIEDYSCQFVVDEALAWLDARKDQQQPFFLNIWFNEPHRSGGPAAPPHLETRHQDTRLPAYYGSVENVDSAIDSIAGRGVRFDRAYLPAAVCSATCSAIALGAMQTSLGVHNHRSSRRWTCRRRRDFRAGMSPPSPSDCTPDLPQPGIRSF